MGRLRATMAILLLLPALAGCFYSDDSLVVALRIDAGETQVISGLRSVDGSILVKSGGALVLSSAELHIAQALVVEDGGRVTATDSRVMFADSFITSGDARQGEVPRVSRRQDVESEGTLAFTNVHVTGVREFELSGGDARLANSSVTANRVFVSSATLRSQSTAWTVNEPSADAPAFQLYESDIGIDGGALTIRAARYAWLQEGGLVHLENMTLTADGRDADVRISEGKLIAHGVTFTDRGGGRFLDVQRGVARFIDSPIPSRTDAIYTSNAGRLEVGWTLTIEAVTPPGNIPVAGLNVTLQSSHSTDAISVAVTDEKGEAHFDAIQYIASGTTSRTGNPHLAFADEGGKRGTIPAFVLEGPMRVAMPVFG